MSVENRVSTAADVVQTLARVAPVDVDASRSLDDALRYLDAPVSGETVVRGGYGAAVVVAFCSFPVVALLASPLVAVAAAFGGGLAAAHVVHRAPVLLARTRRAGALGDAAGVVNRAALRLRLDPTAERAAVFAARTGRGPLAASLAAHVRRARGTPQSGLAAFGDEWANRLPALGRATTLVLASAAATPGERERGLERALNTVLDGTRDRLARFADDVRAPLSGLYAFGVLLPLALVGVLPAASSAGVPVGTLTLVVVYDVFLPLALLSAVAWLVSRRPVAFSPPRVGFDHPDVAVARRGYLVVAAVALAGVGVSVAVVGPWSAPLVAVGGLVGGSLVVRYRPARRVHTRVRRVESGLDDALYLVGRHVVEGVAVERALERVADELDGATGEMLADAVTTQRALRVDVRDAFLGDDGALASVPSPRARSAAELLALAATEGEPAGAALVATAEQLSRLRRLEREARRQLSELTETLQNTGALFGPLVGGATVALVERLGGVSSSPSSEASRAASPLGTGAMDAANTAAESASVAGSSLGGHPETAAFGLAVGVYVLLSAVLLTALATAIEHGLDRVLLGYRIGLALLAATTTYLAAFVAANLLV
ncbi:type II secretion system F family protein [Haloprofundus halophilus]|uniref:type II secretion system F family protein n=1 Tax=Haloprofundus halophilus TaxID=2283527 RepID=UPI000E445826|nr:type II secretion system F family protein [Haloprofundus halophilus]